MQATLITLLSKLEDNASLWTQYFLLRPGVYITLLLSLENDKETYLCLNPIFFKGSTEVLYKTNY